MRVFGETPNTAGEDARAPQNPDDGAWQARLAATRTVEKRMAYAPAFAHTLLNEIHDRLWAG